MKNLVKHSRTIQKLRNVLNYLRNYPMIVWQNLGKNGIMIRFQQSDTMVRTFYLNAIWAGVFAVVLGILLGLAFAGLVSIGFLVYLYFEYRFVFRKYHRNATWNDFLAYKRDPSKYVIYTRGGGLTINDIVEAIDTRSSSFQPILKNIKEAGLKKIGYYKAGKYLQPAIERLKNLGLVHWITIGRHVIGFVNIDAFLVAALQQHSLSLFTLGVNLLNVQVGIYEFSPAKRIFNLALLFGTVSFMLSTTTFLALSSFFNGLGFGPSVLMAKLAQNSLASTVATFLTYAGGQFLPPLSCRPFGEYEGELKTNLLPDNVYLHRPKDPNFNDFNDQASLSTLKPNSPFCSNPETEIMDWQTVGSLDQETCPAPRLRGSQPKSQTKSYMDLVKENSDEFEKALIIRPKEQERSIYQGLKETIDNHPLI